MDPELRRLESLLTKPDKNQGRDFETGFAWLLQVLGFAPIHIGAMSGCSGEPDILVLAPSGEVLIVECTVGVPDDDKLSMLISRTARMREALQRSEGSTSVITVTPILAVPLPAEELCGIRAKAEKHGILILCRPELQESFARTMFAPDADAVLRHWRDLPLTRLLTGARMARLDG
jgi:hypothetical protein